MSRNEQISGHLWRGSAGLLPIAMSMLDENMSSSSAQMRALWGRLAGGVDSSREDLGRDADHGAIILNNNLLNGLSVLSS